MTIFSIPSISLAGERVYHNYSFINVEIKLLIIIILVTNMYHLSLQSKVSWKIQSLHISPEGWSNLLLLNIIVTTFVICKYYFMQTETRSLTQVCAAKQHSWARFLNHTSAFIPWALSSVRLSQWAVNISTIYMSCISFLSKSSPKRASLWQNSYLIRAYLHFIHHKSTPRM